VSHGRILKQLRTNEKVKKTKNSKEKLHSVDIHVDVDGQYYICLENTQILHSAGSRKPFWYQIFSLGLIATGNPGSIIYIFSRLASFATSQNVKGIQTGGGWT